MTVLPTTITYEQMMALFLETREQMKEAAKEYDRQREKDREEYDQQRKEIAQEFREIAILAKQNQKAIGALTSSIGRVIESMVAGNIIDKFQALNYDVTGCSPRKSFLNKKLGIKGEVDLLLDDGDVAILIEVKTTLETADVRKHIETIEKYRRYADARGIGEKQRYIGAVAGAVLEGDAVEFALQNGMYVIVQSGEAFDIVPTPEGFKAKEW